LQVVGNTTFSLSSLHFPTGEKQHACKTQPQSIFEINHTVDGIIDLEKVKEGVGLMWQAFCIEQGTNSWEKRAPAKIGYDESTGFVFL
jgi:hypothetical protein